MAKYIGFPGSVTQAHRVPRECRSSTWGSPGVSSPGASLKHIGFPGSVTQAHRVPWECHSSTYGSPGVSPKHIGFPGDVNKAHNLIINTGSTGPDLVNIFEVPEIIQKVLESIRNH